MKKKLGLNKSQQIFYKKKKEYKITYKITYKIIDTKEKNKYNI